MKTENLKLKNHNKKKICLADCMDFKFQISNLKSRQSVFTFEVLHFTVDIEMISTNQFKNGMTIVLEGALYEISEFQHVKPGKGGAFVRTKLKKLDTGGVVDKTFRAGEKLELAHLDHKKLQYLYSDGIDFNFMDNASYEQLQLSADQVGNASNYITEGMEIDASFHKGKLLSISPPIAVKLKVVEAEPGIKGDTATGATKPVKLETGLSVNVPLFVNEGDFLKIDSRTGEYIERL